MVGLVIGIAVVVVLIGWLVPAGSGGRSRRWDGDGMSGGGVGYWGGGDGGGGGCDSGGGGGGDGGGGGCS